MTLKPILVCDFDGVIIDGMVEYWDSARKACLELLVDKKTLNPLPHKVPKAFRQLRPWVKDGWEMVLLTAELMRSDSPLVMAGPYEFADEYQKNCHEALKFWQWSPQQLQFVLDNVRKQSISINKDKWLEDHVAFPGVTKKLRQLADENIDFGILTTKSSQFTAEILTHLNLYPKLLYGHEAGNKTNLLLQIKQNLPIIGFIEDRRATLETVLKTPGINSIPCYLASWGYLKPNDAINLPSGIHLLKPENLMSPLANWP